MAGAEIESYPNGWWTITNRRTNQHPVAENRNIRATPRWFFFEVARMRTGLGLFYISIFFRQRFINLLCFAYCQLNYPTHCVVCYIRSVPIVHMMIVNLSIHSKTINFIIFRNSNLKNRFRVDTILWLLIQNINI